MSLIKYYPFFDKPLKQFFFFFFFFFFTNFDGKKVLDMSSIRKVGICSGDRLQRDLVTAGISTH